jgi:hypothetical protein
MHRALAALVLSLWPMSAAAETARVAGGEHSDFTRIVVEAREMADWRFGRAEDGYELDLGPAVEAFDVTEAFEKIPRDRVTAIWRDPDTGRLRVSLACACHALAFEFRPGIVVIDIKSGPPPEASGFEQPIDPPAALPDPAPSSPDPAPNADTPAYDWVEMMRSGTEGTGSGDAGVPLPLPTGDASLDPLRDALLAQISRGASEGVVEIDEGALAENPVDPAAEDGPWGRVSVGEMPGVTVDGARDPAKPVTAAGKACIADDALDLGSWGLPGPPAAQIGLARSGMLTEFDAPVAEAVLRAARFHVQLGFGVEARQYLGFLGAEAEEAKAILQALAWIVDGQSPPQDPFAGMESCDTAAALWSVLAAPVDAPLPRNTNAAAVARSFSALPLHLRRHLGGPLVDRFLAAGDEETARQLRDAILRLPAEGDPDVELMDARYHLASGDEATATELAEGVLTDSASGRVEAAVTLVEAAFKGEQTVDPKLPGTLEAYLADTHDPRLAQALERALILALAMTGDHAAAFARIDAAPQSFGDLWSLAADAMPDDLFLAEAARHAGTRPAIAADTAKTVADRLMSLGFPDLALDWLGPVGAEDAEDLRLFAARAHVALREAPAALDLLEGIAGPEEEALRATALVLLGDNRTAAEAYAGAGEAEAGMRTLTWTQDWPLVAEGGPDAWKAAAALLADPVAPEAPGPIGRGSALVEESAAARAVIEGLLGGVPDPPPSQ